MKRRITILTAAIALLAFLAIPMGMWGQNTKTEGFESASTSTTYNSTVTVDANQSDCGIGWSIYYGTVSTTGPIAGSKTAQMRWYKSASTNYPYLKSTTAIDNLTNVAFKAKVGHVDVKMNVHYSSDGTNWTALATDVVFADTYVKNFSYDIPSGGKYIKIGISSNSTVPNGSYYSLLVDDVVFTYNSNINTYTVTYHANVTGVSDIEVEYNEGATVTIADNTFSNTGYTFTEWNTEEDGSGDSYAPGDEIEDIDDDLELYAQWEESTSVTYTYNFAGANNFYTDANLTTHPSSGNSNNVGTIYYGDGSVFVASGTNRYFSSANSGYFMLGKTGAQLSLPTFDGYKITQVIVHTSGSVSTNVQVSIVSGSNTASAAQKWATNSDFTYDIDADYQTSVLSLNVTNNYNSQFTSIELVCEADESSTTPSITANNVEIAYDDEEGYITYSINNPVEGGSITASTEAQWLMVDNAVQNDSEGEIYFMCYENSNYYAHSATVTLTYMYGDSKATITKDVTVTQALDPNANGSTAEYPIMVSEAIEAIDEAGTVSNIYVLGVVSEIITAYNSSNDYVTFEMFDAVGDEYSLRAYHCTGDYADEVAVGDEVVVYGNLCLYNNSIYEFAAGCELVSLTHPVVPSITVTPALVEEDADEHDGTLDLTWENLEIEDIFNDFGIQYYDAEGEETLEPDWIEVLVAEQDPNEGEGYLVSYFMIENEGEARTAYFKVFAMGDEDFVYSNLVTINQAAPVVPGTNGTITFGSAEGSTKINSTSVTGDDSMGNTWTITTVFPNNNNTSFTQNANYSQVGASNKPATSITFTTTLPAEAIISAFEAKFGGFNNTAGDVTLLVDSETVGTGSLNASEDVIVQNTTTATGTVLTVTVTNIARGVKCYYISYTLSTSETETYTLDITGYTNDNTKEGYYLIASPVTVDPATAGMTTGDYDLYYFDQSEVEEWRNYEANPFNLIPGKGYLYAMKATAENPTYSFELTGMPYSDNGEIALDYDDNAEFPGFNLIGNPFATNADLDKPYYRLSSDGTLNTTTESSAVNLMEGVFVQATAANQTATFTPSNSGSKRISQLSIKVTRNRGAVLDNAIIRFDNGAMLGKFQLNPNDTKIYITEGNQDYAIVRSANAGEMPVNFKAAENGNYTLSIETENVEVSYLHLIDNMTGANVDLLATPSYSFDARTTDNANRFRLMFNTNGVDENTTTASFAYFNGSSWTISDMGEATLQVVDMMGRVISTQAISGNTDVNLNQAAGVYMLRLVNGENVMVQKVVVK